MVLFSDVKIPITNVIGELGGGFKFAMKALIGGRINIGSCSLGGAAFAFDTARNYMLERK
jgi:alkylation response protein AidB-like acyl-CoA dehydrogenase